MLLFIGCNVVRIPKYPIYEINNAVIALQYSGLYLFSYNSTSQKEWSYVEASIFRFDVCILCIIFNLYLCSYLFENKHKKESLFFIYEGMTGGTLQLKAYGSENIYLNANPQI
jgi:hypothetical protein